MREKLSLEEATRLALTEELDNKNYVSEDGQTLYLDTLGQTLERADSDSSLPTYEDETETLTAIVGTGKEVYDDMKDLTDKVDEYVESVGYTVDEFCKLGLIAFVYEENYDSHEVIELDTITNTVESKEIVKESYTARERFEKDIQKYPDEKRDRIKVVAETKYYILTAARRPNDKGEELINLAVTTGMSDAVQTPMSMPSVYIDQDWKGTCTSAKINWSAIGSQDIETAKAYVECLQDAVKFAEEIEGKNFSKEV